MPPKKEEKKKDPVVETGFVILVFIFLIVIWSVILDYYIISRVGSYAALWQRIVVWFNYYFWPIVTALSMIISVIAAIGIARLYSQIAAFNREDEKYFGDVLAGKEMVKEEKKKSEKWERVLTHLHSPNAADWRLSIIEADIMLDELLRAQGYHGDSIGDMLKSVDKSDMTTLESAWEAHKVRNRIAHSGAEYHLTEREAKRVITLYESVFKEARVI